MCIYTIYRQLYFDKCFFFVYFAFTLQWYKYYLSVPYSPKSIITLNMAYSLIPFHQYDSFAARKN